MDKLKMQSPNLVESNIGKLAELFPNCVTESKDEDGNLKRVVDFDLLRQELSPHLVEGPQERYTLSWPGKNEAILAANAPVAKTLRPCEEESVDFDTTKNLFIEGDNLDVLKLLQENYLGKVKMIYIDPPYNKGKDYIYKDKFVESKESYEIRSELRDEEGNRLVSNTESNGRFHSDWLCMMYSRLKLARNLLSEEGVIYISIDDNEVANIRRVCDEIYGEQNFIAELVWEKTRKNDSRFFSKGHEYIIVYVRNKIHLRDNNIYWREAKPGAEEIFREYSKMRKKFGAEFDTIEKELKKFYKNLPKEHPAKKHSRYNKVDEKGVWRDDNMSWPGGGGPTYDVIHPVTGKPCKVPPGGWRFSTPEKMQTMIDEGTVVFRNDHTEPPIRKTYLVRRLGDKDERDRIGDQVMGTYFYRSALQASNSLIDLLDGKVFDNPKDEFVIKRLVNYVTEKNDIILDFFAGSATTAHAVMQLNAESEGNRRFIMAQFPEPCDEKSEAFNLGYKNIAEIAKERIRRAGKIIRLATEQKASENNKQLKILEEPSSELTRPPDTGFRVLKVDSSNMKGVYYTPDQTKQTNLELFADHIKEDRRPEDLLFQVLLDWGLDLSLSIVKETIEDKTVFFVDGNVLAACFDTGINEDMVKILARRNPLRAVFRDDGFDSDSVKINVDQIFKLLSPNTEVKTI